MTAINMCSEARDGAHCDELEGHKPVLVNGLKWEHFDHHAGRGWNANGTWVAGPPSPRSFETELAEALPAHTHVTTNGFEWQAVWTTPGGIWVVARSDQGERGHLVAVNGPDMSAKVFNPAVEHVIAVLRLRNALDETRPREVLYPERVYLAEGLEAWASAGEHPGGDWCDGVSAAINWLLGRETQPAPRNENVVMAELVRGAWWLISRAHGGQPWDAHGAWRDRATAWRDAYRLNNPSAELLEAARELIMSAVGNQGEPWESDAYTWRQRFDAWVEARS